MNSRHTISWQAHEYFHQEKTADWYWALGIIAITAATLAIIFSNILFALVIVLFAFAAGMQAHRPARLIDFELTPRGIVIDKTLYPYNTLDSFWITEEHVQKVAPKLLIKSKKLLMPFLHVPIEEVQVDDVRSYLLQYIHEEEHEESILEKILERFGF
jgi:hypothetical protein